jgi:hypothetical protein
MSVRNSRRVGRQRPQLAHNVHHAHPMLNQQGVKRVLSRVPRHLSQPMKLQYRALSS